MAVATRSSTGDSSIRIGGNRGTSPWALRAAAALTTSYVASSHAIVGAEASVTIACTLASVDYTSI